MGFKDAVLTGMAPDGGLLIPDSIPDVSSKLNEWAKLNYTDLAFEIFSLYCDLEPTVLKEIIAKSYAPFRHPEITPVEKVGELYILELFHGPTLAFKDVAMQFLSNCFDHILEERGETLNILGSTSGDTGSAAIYGVKGKEHINIFMLHPKGRTSAMQELQMTSVLDKNVFNISIDGTFDDCQDIMKNIFSDVPFKEKYKLGAVNSVNWCRVLAQTVYYFYSGLKIMKETNTENIQFSVPTGNFGNILAGYFAQRMGLPVKKLILATNENDILARFFNTGEYSQGDVAKTISPSMDIQVASNFERFLYYMLNENPVSVCESMEEFKTNKKLILPLESQKSSEKHFAAGTGRTAETLDVIRRYKDTYNYTLDPHTAVGVSVGEKYLSADCPVICLATAHASKFPEAIIDATGQPCEHEILNALKGGKTKCVDFDNSEAAVRDYIKACLT